MAQKPSIPKGTRDFSPTEVSKRNYIINVMRKHFESFGYQPIETPSFENSESLMGKYGEEGDRLIFKILNSGNYFFNKNKIELPQSIESLQVNSAETISTEELVELNKFTNKISEKALRYDLTVPFARYVVQHQNEIEFPFKRYQIQPVWRADRPQKGRFREFYQCDADVVGSTSLWQEVELVQLYDAVFADLGLKGVTIKINNRKILSGIAEVIGASDKLIDFTVALDKLDKIGEEGVKKEMLEKGISQVALQKVQPLFNFTGTITEKLEKLSELLASSSEGKKGIEEVQFICNNVTNLGLQHAELDLDVTLARGLNYYTGAIFEVVAPKEISMGSIGGGGRYDDLTGIFGLKNMSGVGISFGLDRIYLVLGELNLFPKTVTVTTQVLFLNFGENQALQALKIINTLRKNNIKAELYPDATKIDKQFKHAEKRAIPFVVKEIKNEILVVKNILTGEQKEVTIDELINLNQSKQYYFENVRSKEHIQELGKKLYVKITEVIQSEVQDITQEDCINYMFQLVIDRTFDGYMTEINTIYGQLQKILNVKIEPAPDEWDRLFNVDFYIKVNDKYIGLQIKPVNSGIQLPEIHKEYALQAETHQKFTEVFGGKVFYLFSSKIGDKKEIANKEVIIEIQNEIERLKQ